jgi:ADP-heptose:LPS heptosyltransferase
MQAPFPLLERVRKIAVLRPNAVGDFVFALPALHALKQAYPAAELVYVGKPWHADFLRARPGPVDRVLVLPPVAGVGAALDAGIDPLHGERFLDAMRAERFDIAAQMFGGGRHSNPFMARFGARLTVGAKADDAPPLQRWVRYGEPANRRLALLEVAALAGARPAPLGQELAVLDADRCAANAVLAPTRGTPLAVLQPGSTDPRRCWPAARFAAVGDALARDGVQVAVNGTAAEAPLVRAVIEAMRHPAADLSGKLSLGGLCGLIERAQLVVSNDTGPLHLALALGTPCVGIFWLTNLVDGMPLRQSLLRAALSVRVHCPVCGAENRASRCAHDASFVADVTVEEVTSMATSLLRAGGQVQYR